MWGWLKMGKENEHNVLGTYWKFVVTIILVFFIGFDLMFHPGNNEQIVLALLVIAVNLK